jgi:hypothetical protein
MLVRRRRIAIGDQKATMSSGIQSTARLSLKPKDGSDEPPSGGGGHNEEDFEAGEALPRDVPIWHGDEHKDLAGSDKTRGAMFL